jgi:hypothetical protein
MKDCLGTCNTCFIIRSKLPWFFLAPTAATRISYATPHPTMSTSMGWGATAIHAPHLFVGAASGPRNLLHHDTMLGYGLTASTVIHLQPQQTTTTTTTVRMNELRGKLAIESTLGSFLSIFRTSRYCHSTPPFAYYKKGGRDPRQKRRQRLATAMY